MHLFRQTLIALVAIFIAVIIVSWANEYYDLPYWLLSETKTEVNWPEALLETAFIFVAFTAAIAYITRYERKTRYLKQFYHICSECRKVRRDDVWISLDDFLRDSANVVLSHGICPYCMKENHPTEYRRLVALGFMEETLDDPKPAVPPDTAGTEGE